MSMNEHDIRNLVEEVREGKLPRRSFIQQMVSVAELLGLAVA